MNKDIEIINNSDNKITLKQDFVFKKLFSENENLLKSLLEAILNVKITKIDVVKDFTLDNYLQSSRGGILDIKAEINGKTTINIEMQVRNEHNITDRLLFYSSSLRNMSVKKGKDFSDVKPVISIGILDYINYPHKEATNFFSESKFVIFQTNLEGKQIELETLNQKHRIIIIELPKFNKIKHHLNDKLQQWLTVIEWKNFKEIENVMKSNEEIKEAVKQLTTLIEDNEVRAVYEYELQTEILRNTEDRILKEKSIAEGKKQGIKQGKEEGIKEGLEKGMEKGMEKGIKQTILKFIQSGLSKKQISEILEIDLNKLEQLIK